MVPHLTGGGSARRFPFKVVVVGFANLSQGLAELVLGPRIDIGILCYRDRGCRWNPNRRHDDSCSGT